MTSVLVLKDPSELDGKIVEYLGANGAFRSVALTGSTWLSLRPRMKEVLATSDLLGESDLGFVFSEAKRLASAWSAPFADLLKYRNLDLAELIRLEHLHFFRAVVAAEKLAVAIASRLQPDRVFMYVRSEVPCVRIHRHMPTHDIFQIVLDQCLRRLGIRAVNLYKPYRGRLPWIPLRWKKGVLALIRGQKHRDSPGKSSPVIQRTSLPVARGGRKLLAGVGEEVDLHSLAPFLELLRDDHGWDTTLVNVADETPRLQGRSGIGGIDAQRIFHLKGLPTRPAPIQVGRLSQARRAFDDLRRGNSSIDHPVLNNRRLDLQFDLMWKHWVDELLPHIDRMYSFLQGSLPDVVAVAGCEMSKDRATVQIAGQLGIPTLAIPHGYLGDVDAFDFETDSFLAWGRASRKCLTEELRKDPDTIGLFAPRHLVSLSRAAPQPQPSATRARRLLVITSRTSIQGWDPVRPVDVEQAWLELIRFVKSRDDVELIIKPHPGGADAVAWYEQMCSPLPTGRVRFEKARRLEELAGEVDAALAMIDASTAILVTQILSIPTVFARIGWRRMPWAVRAWGQPDGLESIEAAADLGQALHQLLFDEPYRQRCLAAGKRLLAENIEPDSELGPACDLRLVLERLLARSKLSQPLDVASQSAIGVESGS